MNASVILYMLSSSSMLILNKMALVNFNSPTCLLIIQLWFSACFVFILGRTGVVELNELSYKTANKFKLVPLSFLLILYANMKILQHSNVETFIIIRASTTVIMSILDVEFLNRQLPSLKSWVSIVGVLLCTIGYGLAEHTDLTSDSLLWIVIWYSLFCFDQIYIKHVVDTFKSMNRWDMVFYNNSMPLLLLVPFYALTENYIEITGKGLFLIILSCLCGTALSFCGFWARKEVSATKFTVIGNVCKFLTILLNYLLWDRHASELGIFFIIVGIVFTFGYNQSPTREHNEVKPSLLFFYSVCTLILLCGIYFIYILPTNAVESIFEGTQFIHGNVIYTKPYTLGLASHGRKNVLRNTIDKARDKYENLKIIVVDDGKNDYSDLFNDVEYVKLEYDSGLSATRNELVKRATTEYIFITDEDIQISDSVDLDEMLNLMLTNDYLLIAGSLDDRGIYAGTYTYLNNGKVEVCDHSSHFKKLSNGCVPSRRTLNLFMTRVSTLLKSPWNNTLKLQEHTVFFEQLHRNNLEREMVICPQFKFHHNKTDNENGYKKYRKREKWPTRRIISSCKETNKKLNFMHIPKTGGVSFYNDMKKLGIKFTSVSPGGNEKCFPGKEYTMLRDPRTHVLSQYVMCRYSKWGKTKRVQSLWTDEIDMFHGFEIWLDYFMNNTDNLGCYYPYNLQTRALLCGKNNKPHTYSDKIDYNVDDAFANLKKLKYGYGILEQYDMSLCKFLNRFGRAMPDWCTNGKSKPKNSKVSHGVPKHSYDNVPSRIKNKAEYFIQHDLRLYDLATGVKKQSECNVLLNYGVQTMPYCGALKQLHPKPHLTPRWLRDKIRSGNFSDIRFSLQQQLVSKTPYQPQKVLTGLGLLELENGDYVGLNRKIPFDTFTKKEPHKSEQMVEIFDKDFFPKDTTRPCMIGFGADIRIFQHKNQVFGYTIMTSEYKGKIIDMILYNLNTCMAYVVLVDEWETFEKFGKNWMAFTFNDELYFVHSLVPKLTLVKVNISDEITEYRNTKLGQLPILKGKVIQSKTTNENKKQLNRRGSTHGIVFDNYVWGIGHSSDYRDRKNSFQRPFLWYFNFSDLESPVEFIEMVEEENDQPKNRFIFPISIISNNEELMMTATDSFDNWFRKETMNGYYPLSNVKNSLFKLS